MAGYNNDDMYQKMIGLIMSGFIDIAEIIRWRAAYAESEAEKRLLEQMGYEVEHGYAEATILDTDEVPPEVIEKFAAENGFNVFRVDPLNGDRAAFIVPKDRVQDILDEIERKAGEPDLDGPSEEDREDDIEEDMEEEERILDPASQEEEEEKGKEEEEEDSEEPEPEEPDTYDDGAEEEREKKEKKKKQQEEERKKREREQKEREQKEKEREERARQEQIDLERSNTERNRAAQTPPEGYRQDSYSQDAYDERNYGNSGYTENSANYNNGQMQGDGSYSQTDYGTESPVGNTGGGYGTQNNYSDNSYEGGTTWDTGADDHDRGEQIWQAGINSNGQDTAGSPAGMGQTEQATTYSQHQGQPYYQPESTAGGTALNRQGSDENSRFTQQAENKAFSGAQTSHENTRDGSSSQGSPRQEARGTDQRPQYDNGNRGQTSSGYGHGNSGTSTSYGGSSPHAGWGGSGSQRGSSSGGFRYNEQANSRQKEIEKQVQKMRKQERGSSSTLYANAEMAGMRSGANFGNAAGSSVNKAASNGTTNVQTISKAVSRPGEFKSQSGTALYGLIMKPVEDLQREDPGLRELRRLQPAWDIIKAGGSVAENSRLIHGGFHDDISTLSRRGRLDELDSVIRSNEGHGINISSESELEKSMEKLFGKDGWLNKNGIDISKMTDRDLARALERMGLSSQEARRAAKQLRDLEKRYRSFQNGKENIKLSLKRAAKSTMRYMFRDNEGIQSMMATAEAVEAMIKLLKKAHKIPPSRLGRWIHKVGVQGDKLLAAGVSKAAKATVQATKTVAGYAKWKATQAVTGTPVAVGALRTKKWFNARGTDIKRFSSGVKKKGINFARNTANRFKGTRAGRVSTNAVSGVKNAGRWFSASMQKTGTAAVNFGRRMKGVGSRIAKPFKAIGKPFKVVSKSFKSVSAPFKKVIDKLVEKVADVLKRFNIVTNTIRKVIIVFASFVIVFTFLSVILIGIASIVLSVVTGFFTYDDEQDIQTAIMDKVYTNLCQQEKDWLEDLSKSGQPEGLFNGSHPVEVTDQYYMLDELDLEEYCEITPELTYWNGGVKGLLPFNGTPRSDDAYKTITTIDGGNEVFFCDGFNQAVCRSSNIRDIISMSTAFYMQGFDTLDEEPGFLDKVREGVGKILDGLNALYKNFLARALNITHHITIYDRAEINKNSELTNVYCTTLFQSSHRMAFELELQTLPISTDELAEQEMSTWINRCPESESFGCKQYDEFYYLDNGGGISADGSTPAGGTVHPLDDDCSLLSDEEKATSPCWERHDEVVSGGEGTEGDEDSGDAVLPSSGADAVGMAVPSESLFDGPYFEMAVEESETNTVEGDTGGAEEGEDAEGGTGGSRTVTTYTHNCQGNHSGKYCGGHLKLSSIGYVYTMTDEQIEGKCVGKPCDFNVGVTDETVINEDEIRRLQSLGHTDIFDIDANIHHVTTLKTWDGWNASNMAWAGNLYNQDWYDLYGIRAANRAEGGYNGGGYSEAEIAEIMAALMASYGNLPALNQAVVSEAYRWIGSVGYDQAHHTDPLAIGSLSDCSGFVSNVIMNSGKDVGMRTSRYYYGVSKPFDSLMRPGDVVARDGHVMIYAGVDEAGNVVCLECNSFAGKHGPGITKVRRTSLGALAASGYRYVPVGSLPGNYTG